MVGGFKALSGKELLVLLFITIVSVVIDHTSGALGAKYGGAHTKSLLWGILGAIVGTFVFPAFGSFIGLFASVLVAELCYKKTKEKALKAASGALIGSAVGVIANICLSIAFVILFFFFAENVRRSSENKPLCNKCDRKSLIGTKGC